MTSPVLIILFLQSKLAVSRLVMQDWLCSCFAFGIKSYKFAKFIFLYAVLLELDQLNLVQK